MGMYFDLSFQDASQASGYRFIALKSGFHVEGTISEVYKFYHDVQSLRLLLIS